jgi:hypothetical protein
VNTLVGLHVNTTSIALEYNINDYLLVMWFERYVRNRITTVAEEQNAMHWTVTIRCSTLTYSFILHSSRIVHHGCCSMFQAKYRAYLSIRRGGSNLIESVAY